jgi:hypothetical protein
MAAALAFWALWMVCGLTSISSGEERGALLPALRAPADVTGPLRKEAATASPGLQLKDPAALSRPYSAGDLTLFPYIGAGYGGGYGSELDRAIAAPPSAHADAMQRGSLGQSFVPNEVHMGVRIPF